VDLITERQEKKVIDNFGDMILKAYDTRDAANIKLYARKSKQQSIDTWMQEDVIPLRLKMYSKKKSHLISNKSSKKISSLGQTFNIEYISLSILKKKNTERREVAFTFFHHNNYYFHFFIFNKFAKKGDKGWRYDIKKEVEEKIIPAIILFSPKKKNKE
jgi:hypothetical protein